MKTCQRLLKASVNKNVAVNSDKEFRHETTNRNTTVLLRFYLFSSHNEGRRQNSNNRCRAERQTNAAQLETEHNSGTLCFCVEDVEYTAP